MKNITNRNLKEMEIKAKLFLALNKEPENYSWNGVIVEYDSLHPGQCACGHTLRYGFPLVHKTTGREVITGCVCVESAPYISQNIIDDMQTAQAILQKRIADEKKRMKEFIQLKEISELTNLRDYLHATVKRFIQYRNSQGLRVEYNIWCLGRERFTNIASYKQKSAAIKKLNQEIEYIRKTASDILSADF